MLDPYRERRLDRMDRTGLMKPRRLFFLFVIVFALSVPLGAYGAEQEFTAEGDPTDPELTLSIALEYEVDVESHGIDLTAEVDSWLQRLVELLRSLGLIPEESGP
jgi:hypothetical protein